MDWVLWGRKNIDISRQAQSLKRQLGGLPEEASAEAAETVERAALVFTNKESATNVKEDDMFTVPASQTPFEELRPGDHELPLQVGTVIDCKHPGEGDRFVAAKILKRRKAELGGEAEYYVHFLGVDRRWDRWINLDAMDLSTSTLEIPDLLGEDNSATPTAAAPIISQLSAGSVLQDSTETLAFIVLGRFQMRTEFLHEELGLREDLRSCKPGKHAQPGKDAELRSSEEEQSD